ncbi:hypothetical protein SERLA73DRAFT_131037 [Serpula lacrymans var. lacrymans S7.3]|uniref:Uncharacterized protein n=2 Tax=Serpula lacrymans var. lacrymans TaxID=341189 RepID=F8PMC2_SERL3|nr:uncharacterized protein SERLADRAFT_380123 [Serpula lacrymans var. lacrymans S7.9]EGO02754.1 hypothetical protein SERLA73DRAFT_131037 [Serpula lacrymans var. lacrymans S7.3]EGO28455.1 hypothetical protein SERLADRAFT_380123 [Serpula lacrymans var. lacrymans S7.9]
MLIKRFDFKIFRLNLKTPGFVVRIVRKPEKWEFNRRDRQKRLLELLEKELETLRQEYLDLQEELEAIGSQEV